MSKLDLIIKALQVSYAHVPGDIADRHHEALVAARELKALKPVAWMLPKYNDVISAYETDGTGIYNIPLYALDEEAK